MTAPAAILAVYANWRTVIGRKVLQLTFEVPLEQQADVLAKLGAPNPQTSAWYAIGKAVVETGKSRGSAAAEAPPDRGNDAPEAGASEASPAPPELAPGVTRPKTPGERAVACAAICCEDREFQNWLCSQYPDLWQQAGPGSNSDVTATVVRQACNMESRSELATNSKSLHRWHAIHARFMQRNDPPAVGEL